MAEGLDGAAAAFQSAINPTPGSGPGAQPRDSGGRFTAASRPETMFEPRPLEGDETTGDTRDAGDDPRLEAMERRIADGRAEEGDEEFAQRRGPRLPDDAARAGPARGDDGHRRTAPQQDLERAGVAESQDQDGEERDGDASAETEPGNAEGQSQRDPEGPQFKVTLNGEPVAKFEVTVDGRPEEVSLNEALHGYIRDQTFRKRMSEVDVARHGVEAEAQTVVQGREAVKERLAYLDYLIQGMTPAEPDWDKEFAANPQAAHENLKRYRAIHQQRAELDAQWQRTHAEQQADQDTRSKKYAIDQFTQFVQDANIQDEKALNETLSLMRSYGRREGFSEGELASTYDKRMLVVLRKAALYDQLMSNRPRAAQPGKGKTLIPGAASPIGNAARRHIDEAQQKLAKTGRLEDAASVFSRLIR
jgi:hypothetical protein